MTASFAFVSLQHLTVIFGRLAVFVVVLEVVILARKDGVDHNADDGGDGQTGEVQRELADMEGDRARGGEGDAQRQRDNQRNDDDVAALGQIHAVLNEVAHADGGDHAVENQGDAADGAGRHGGNERRELRAEGRDDRVDGGQTDDQRIIHAGQRQNAGVLAVGGVGRRAEEGRDARGETVAQQGAMQTRIGDEVAPDGGGDRADIADVLDHGRERDGHDGDDGGDEQVHVAVADEGEDGVFHLHRWPRRRNPRGR